MSEGERVKVGAALACARTAAECTANLLKRRRQDWPFDLSDEASRAATSEAVREYNDGVDALRKRTSRPYGMCL